ncbi:MAG: histidinol-phosphatase [Candidatus Aminicenantes bacterium]|nr:histidinol-phosphatase [Candidatus Aminicenantes bacterium]
MEEIFKHGSTWERADFHLHTRADKEFEYKGEDNSFVTNYVEKLKEKNIRIGIITNHNKFDKDEFTALKKKARNEEIYLIPGVELSVSDGAGGIHILIVFSDQWLENGHDYISSILSSLFPGKAPGEYQHENGRSDKNILQVVEELDKTSRDYFLIFAHVEQRNGLWEEMSGGKLGDFSQKRYDIVRRRTFAFQKVRTHDLRTKVQGWLGNWYPAEVEGSDCKSIDEIGKGEPTFLKLGAYTFEAVKYALRDYKNRVSKEAHTKYPHSHIKSISFEGGIMNGKTIHFSPELNALIGIRGSGKSSILEALRYTLDIPLGGNAMDIGYKEELVRQTLGSGGKAVVSTVDRYSPQGYEVKRILNEQAEFFVKGKLQPGVSIRETVINKPIYFGQKDLTKTGEGFEKDLVEKLVGENFYDMRRKIEEQKQMVEIAVDRWLKLSNIDEQKQEYQKMKDDAEFRLIKFKESGVEEKLQKQTDYEADERKLNNILTYISKYQESLSEFIGRHEDELKNHRSYKSKQDNSYIFEFFKLYDNILQSFENIKSEQGKTSIYAQELKKKVNEFEQLKKSFMDEFAGIRRTLEQELKEKGAEALNPEEFPLLQKKIDTAKQMLDAFDKQEKQRNSMKKNLLAALSQLNGLWQQEFQGIKAELDKINRDHSALTIEAGFKGDKKEFLSFMQSMFKGSKIRENTFSGLIDKYSDFGDMYKDWNTVKANSGSAPEVFEDYFFKNLKALLTWQVPNKFTINYHDKELKHHSLGQRASVLILFILSQQENDVVIIDQPEDDLDNQTIYEDVIKLIQKIKSRTQFIFATHNANIPVLGDAEQIHSCRFADGELTIESGSIDSPTLQKEIVNIMEGGKDAFEKRKEIYEIWKPLN